MQAFKLTRLFFHFPVKFLNHISRMLARENPVATAINYSNKTEILPACVLFKRI